MHSLRPQTATLAAIVIAVAVVACDSSQQHDRSIQAPQRPRGAFLQSGKIRRLNLPTAEAQASVLYKDPVQGVKDATGWCRFPDIGQNSAKMRIGLMATVGEWNIETCAGLLYYFKPGQGRPQKPTREETTFATPIESR